MIERGPATEDEVVLAFLRAEIDSSRYDEHITQPLVRAGLTRQLIDEPNLADPAENAVRKKLLDFRGYGQGIALFEGFPKDAIWRRVALEPGDFERMRYAKSHTWIELSDGTRLVSAGARNFPARPDDPETYQINGIVEALRNGARFPELSPRRMAKAPLF